MDDQLKLRELLLQYFEGQHAHIPFKQAVKNVPFDKTGIRPEGLPHSIWELSAHIQLAQRDIIEFCQNPNYEPPKWPNDYWPKQPEPENEEAWTNTIEAVQQGRETMTGLINDSKTDLLAPIPHGDGQTLFRETILIVDHNSYHTGQIVQVRRLLGIWPK